MFFVMSCTQILFCEHEQITKFYPKTIENPSENE